MAGGQVKEGASKMNKNLKQIAVPQVRPLGLVLKAIMWASAMPFGDMNCCLRKPLVRLRVGEIFPCAMGEAAQRTKTAVPSCHGRR